MVNRSIRAQPHPLPPRSVPRRVSIVTLKTILFAIGKYTKTLMLPRWILWVAASPIGQKVITPQTADLAISRTPVQRTGKVSLRKDTFVATILIRISEFVSNFTTTSTRMGHLAFMPPWTLPIKHNKW